MKKLIIILTLSGCAYLPKYPPVMTMTMELMGCEGQVFEKHIIQDFKRNSDSIQWGCEHGTMVYRGNYRVTKR